MCIFEAKSHKTSGFNPVTYFNLIHLDCHSSAIKQARAGDEWESALLQNGNTRCNALLSLGGPEVPETQFTTALTKSVLLLLSLLSYSCYCRYDTNLLEATGLRETSPTLAIHDFYFLLLRFADLQSFSCHPSDRHYSN
jgi:E3 ubiquitin-protein ligase UBR4